MAQWLAGGGYPPEILKLSWKDWTPDTAELVRQHFLAPLSQDPKWKLMPLDWVVDHMRRLRHFSEEEEYLKEQAWSYCGFLERQKTQGSSSTASATRTPEVKEPVQTPPEAGGSSAPV